MQTAIDREYMYYSIIFQSGRIKLLYLHDTIYSHRTGHPGREKEEGSGNTTCTLFPTPVTPSPQKAHKI